MSRLLLVALASVLIAASGLAVESTTPAAKAVSRNRLGEESSPYLKLHKDNPVHWFAWGPDAFAEAKRTNRPIFLSIGYSSCHWCHVMNRESFADPKVAEILNRDFVCVKLDREERPDVDAVYISAVQALTRGGAGWPLSVFLLPDGRPFFGGTYFPPVDRTTPEGRVAIPGFPRVLAHVTDLWKTRRADVEKQATVLADFLRREGSAAALTSRALTEADKAAAIDKVLSGFDPEHAGLGSPPRFAPKFPQASALLLLIEWAKQGDADRLLAPVVKQAVTMARGGIHDHVGGGFHRYSVDREWLVPHFEKMLYDQAQLVSVYSQLHRLRPDPLFERVVADVVGFVDRELTVANGLVGAALDADSEHEEGKFYVWPPDELRVALGADAAWAAAMLGAAGEPNFEGKHILWFSRSTAEVAKEMGIPESELRRRWQSVRERLFEIRAKRPRPLKDIKAIASWNGLWALSLADAASAFPKGPYRERALAAAEAIRKGMTQSGAAPLARQVIEGKAKGAGYCDDYAAVALAFAAAHRLDPARGFANDADRLVGVLVEKFHDPAGKGFFYSAKDQEALVAPVKDSYDGAMPGASNLAVLALIEVAAITGKRSYADVASESILAQGTNMVEGPIGLSVLWRARERLTAIEPTLNAPSPDARSPIRAIATIPAALTGKPGESIRFRVSIEVAPPWHINANPAEPAYLKPTELKIAAGQSLVISRVHYPKPREMKVGGIDEPVKVWQGVVAIDVEGTIASGATPGDAPIAGELTYQACDDEKCLAPAKRPFSISLKVSPR